MPARGQHDADRGEHRGPQQAQFASRARGARARTCVGGSHGGPIIPLPAPAPGGRSANCRTTGRSCSGTTGTRLAHSRTTYTVCHGRRIPHMGGITSIPGLRKGTGGNT
ncbi:hypothetical protein GCM10018783_48060 [Streptomyces griseosporeus]|nr:hypothetical protein GCM10018783_48060 [Streptomyces griseosporeus]